MHFNLRKSYFNLANSHCNSKSPTPTSLFNYLCKSLHSHAIKNLILKNISLFSRLFSELLIAKAEILPEPDLANPCSSGLSWTEPVFLTSLPGIWWPKVVIIRDFRINNFLFCNKFSRIGKKKIK